ncbi:hypothetical protein HPB47_021309 [Ixodes persulcatus]|uniref:Uncharacterized protein n=1 Tax=Ixodes persulcatus TaxID=34615 RepID=A0AC60QF90_IXOPE|nr:hypothetical protein HPB47_021309 [Ixodes persulcatus]
MGSPRGRAAEKSRSSTREPITCEWLTSAIRRSAPPLSGLLLLPSMAANSDFKTDVLHFLVDAYAGRFASGDDNTAQNVAIRKVLQGAILKALVPAKKTKLSDFAELLVSLLAHMKDSLVKEEHIARLESRRREQNQRCKRRRRAMEAKRKGEARRRQHSTPAEQFPGATAMFRREFAENLFGVTCAVCDRIWFAVDVSMIGGVSDKKNRETGGCALRQCIESAVVYKEPACGTCRDFLLKGAVPWFATVNGYKYPPVPEHVPRLNVVEERLVAPRLPFMSLRQLMCWKSSEARKQLKRARSLVDKVDSAAGIPEGVATAFKILLCYLTVLVSLEVAEDPSVLQVWLFLTTGSDLCSCAKQLLAEEEEGERLDGWVHLVVDTTLSTLSMSSQPVRTVATAAFSLVRGHLSDASLALLLKVFRSKKDEDEDEDEEDEEEAMDEEVDEEESESEESDIDSEDKSGPDEELRARLRLALGTAAADEDAEESSEAEVVPTDEQMFQLDGAIAEAFKSRLGPSKKELSKEQTDNIHFQIRCLDLVTAYAEGGPPLHHLVKIVKVLVAASSLPEFRSNQAATNAVANTLQAINGVRKGVGSKGTPWYIAMYMKSLASYLDESSHISPQLFVKFMEAFPEHCYDFIVALGEKAASCLQRNHKRLQMLGLLVAALRLIQVESVPKQKLGASLMELADLSVKMLSEMVEKKEPKLSVAVELCDLLLLASKQSAAVGLESPVRGNTPLASTLASLKGFKVSKEKLLKRKINEILREIQGSKVTDASQGSKIQKKKRPASDEADATSRKTKKKAQQVAI